MSEIVLTVLGCGSSSGCPVAACPCPVCTGSDPKNRRTRCAAWLQIGGRHWIIDTGPEFRLQALRERIPRVDAVLYTHAHADHFNGIDDLRAFCFRQKSAIDVYGSAHTIEQLHSRFSYTLLEPNRHWNRPVLTPHILCGSRTTIDGIEIRHRQLPHGIWQSTVFRIGNIAWLTDIGDIDTACLNDLRGLDYLFLDCLMDKRYPTHLGVQQAFDFSREIKAKHTYFIHMSHLLDYRSFAARCPENTAPAYDGLQVRSPLR